MHTHTHRELQMFDGIIVILNRILSTYYDDAAESKQTIFGLGDDLGAQDGIGWPVHDGDMF